MGHIELAAPVTHIWYFKGVPSRLGYLLDLAPEGPREDHLLRLVRDHERGRRGASPRPVDDRERDPRREAAGRERPRLGDREAGRQARGRPGRAGGRGRQGGRPPQGQGGRRARDAPDPRPGAARDRPPRRGARHLPQARLEAAGHRRAALPRAARPVRRVLHRRHGRRGDQGAGAEHGPRRRGREPARDHPLRQGPAQDPRAQAAQGRRGVPEHPQLAARHGAGLRPGHPAGPAPDGAARRWPVRDLAT